MAAAHARLDAYAHNPYSLNKAETPFTGGCDHCDTITMSTLDRLIANVVARVRPGQAHLADRVRLPDEPARPVPRRLEDEAGALHRRGRAARLPRAEGGHAHPVPDPGRAGDRPLAERRPDRARAAEAVVRRAPDPARRAVPRRPRRPRSGARSARAPAPGATASSSSGTAAGTPSAAPRARPPAATSPASSAAAQGAQFRVTELATGFTSPVLVVA